MRKLLLLIVSLSIDNQIAIADVADKSRELAGIQVRIKRLVSNIGQLRKKKKSLQEQLTDIEKQYGQTALALKQLKKQFAATQRQLQQIRKDIKQQQKSIERQVSGLEDQMRAAYAMGRREKLKLLLNQQDPSLSSRIMVYYSYFNTARLDKLDELKRSVHRLNELELQNIAESEHLKMLQAKKRLEYETLRASKQKREALLVKLNRQFAEKEKKLYRFREDEKALRQLLVSLRAETETGPSATQQLKSFAGLQGQLPWPVKGRLLKKFGSKRAESRWDGVLINAEEGAEIHAVMAGKVIFADWLRGYGLLIIIDHGEHYMTLYAFNQSLYKQVGDWVQAGDVIAAVGNSGGRARTGLYFGIRKKGKPIDPVHWCRKLHKGITG